MCLQRTESILTVGGGKRAFVAGRWRCGKYTFEETVLREPPVETCGNDPVGVIERKKFRRVDELLDVRNVKFRRKEYFVDEPAVFRYSELSEPGEHSGFGVVETAWEEA